MPHFPWLLIFFDFILLYQSVLEADLRRLHLLCQAQCLQTFKAEASVLEQKKITGNPFLIESFCLNNSKCKGCSGACPSSVSSIEKCQINCQTLQEASSWSACSQSCVFINSLKLNRDGICDNNNTLTNCGDPCHKDVDCIKPATKCCKTLSCGFTCQIGNLSTSKVPPTPPAPNVHQTMTKKDRDQITFDLDWSSYDISSVDYPVLFLVQVRVGQLVQDKKSVAGAWQDLISTTKSGVIISAIDPENWYQFRLLAFSKNGYKNNGKMTVPITIQYQPTHPLPPCNVREKGSRIKDKQVSVTLTWQPGPSAGLIPLSNYKINWKKFHELYENSNLFPEYDIIIPATETSYTIHNLLPSMTYKVQITSVIVFKGTKYNSSSTNHYVTTTYISSSLDPGSLTEHLNTCSCRDSYKPLPVLIHNSTVIHGKLSILIKLKNGIQVDKALTPYSYRIKWYATMCIKSNFWKFDTSIFDIVQSMTLHKFINYYITDLRIQCAYKFVVELYSPLTKKNIKKWNGCFCSLSCDTMSKSNKELISICTDQDQHIPPKPENIKISLQKSKNKFKYFAKLQWNCVSSNDITGFRVTWGPRLEEPIDIRVYTPIFLPLLDFSKTTSKIVKYPQQQLLLENLDIDKIYLVKLQTMNKQLSSQESVFFFKVDLDKSLSTIPRFQIPLLVPFLILAFVV